LDLIAALQWEIQPSNLVSPDLASMLGELFSEESLDKLEHGSVTQRGEHERLRKFFGELRFAAQEGQAQVARDLLSPAGLPRNADEVKRSLFAPARSILSPAYSAEGLGFFRLCRPAMSAPAEQLAEWGRAAASDEQRIAFLHYLLSGDLSAQVAQQLRQDPQTSWLSSLVNSPLLAQAAPDSSDRVRVLAALNQISPDQIAGLGAATAAPPAVIDPTRALRAIADWWDENREQQIQRFEARTYPSGQLSIEPDFLGRRTDGAVRADWLELLVLGATHTLGRTQSAQNRDFLDLSRRRGWLEVFSTQRGDFDAEAWMAVIRSYLDVQLESAEFFHWMRLFVPIFQLSYWLDEYVELFLDADRHFARPRASFDMFLSPAADPARQGGGLTAPPLGRTLGIGANFVLRELARIGILTNPHTLAHCFVPSRRVRTLMAALGCEGMLDNEPRSAQAKYISDFLVTYLGPYGATFGGAFDIPLSIVAMDKMLQGRFLGVALDVDESDGDDLNP
jgi:hypothetical protein